LSKKTLLKNNAFLLLNHNKKTEKIKGLLTPFNDPFLAKKPFFSLS